MDSRILEAAISLKQAFNSDIRIVHSYVPITDSDNQLSNIRAQHQTVCEDLMSSFQLDNEQLSLIDGPLPVVLPEYARRLDTDVVVMGAVSRSRPEDIFIGHTAELVLDYLDCDVLVVKAEGFQSPILGLPAPDKR